GSATYEATQVGANSFANKLTASAKAYRAIKTPLQQDVGLVIGILMLIALFIGFMILISAILYSIPALRSVQMAAVIAGLVPNGLFFMVIVAYALGALRIVQRGALIQQSNSVESLSNVTVLCMDKTGTLTANRIHYSDVLPIGIEKAELLRILGEFAHSATTSNKTSEAIAAALPGEKLALIDEVPFSSARKWSALTLASGVYALGALEMLEPYLKADHADVSQQLQAWSDEGLRVLVFAHSPEAVKLHDGETPILPHDLEPIGLLCFGDELRPSLKETLEGFAKANIRLKVISGDNPHTVAALAKQAGFAGDLKVISGTELTEMSDSEFDQIAEETTVFGRITPEQKEKLVDALRRRGHYVAMIGDGVNDVLSLKKAHLGIAMQSGSAATRGVADMILLNDSFAALPPAFLEGQRIVSGMRDILRLFLTRALMVALMIISVAMVGTGFPFVPKHVSLLTLLTVGIPTFALAIWARPAQSSKRLLNSVLHFVLPATLTIFVFALMVYLFYFVTSYNHTLGLVVTPDEIAAFQQDSGITYELPTQDDYAFEVAGQVARTALTTFTVLTGLLLVVFVQPTFTFFAGGDDLTDDRRPTYLAGGLLIAFALIVLITPLRRFFELIVLRPADYALIVAAVLAWMLVLRFMWKGRWLERLLTVEAL
ncbi:MAG: HAD-IC family P-type ATPase, partial [Chloroflexota bacterium]